MANWQFLYTYGGGNVDSVGSWRNLTGSAVLSASKVSSGSAGFNNPMAGVYRCTFTSPTTITCAVVSMQDTGNPLIWAGAATVTADGSTANLNVISGWSIVFASDVQTGDVFEIGCGCYLDTTLNTWQRILSFGPRVASYISGTRALITKNIYGATLSDCMLVATNAVRVENDQAGDRPFHSLYQTGMFDPTADDDLNGTAVTFANYAAGSPATVDLLIDGETQDVIDVAADSMVPDGEDLSCDGSTVYRFPSGSKFQGVEFVLSDSLTGSDTATLYVSNGGESVQIGDDNGSYVAGPAGLILTETGEAAGDITDDGEVDFSIRMLPSPDATDLNMRSFSLRVVGMDGTTMVSNEYQGSFFLTVGEAALNCRINVMSDAYPKPGGGYYGSWKDYLAANGITFVDA